jgi:Uma2 family endonuclease
MRSEQFLMLGEDPPGIRLELAHGEIVMSPSPTPDHSDIVFALVEILRPYIRKNGLGKLYGDTDTVLDEWNTRRPDLIFVSAKQLATIQRQKLVGAPELCVEVISPGSEKMDRGDKFALYEGRGVKHYWIFDPVKRTAEAYVLKRGKYVLAGEGKGKAVVTFPPFKALAMDLAAVWPGK